MDHQTTLMMMRLPENEIPNLKAIQSQELCTVKFIIGLAEIRYSKSNRLEATEYHALSTRGIKRDLSDPYRPSLDFHSVKFN